MIVADIKSIIISSKYEIVGEDQKANCIALKINNGAVINCYNTGKHVVQGKNTKEVVDLIDGKTGQSSNRKIFVVYGHDEIAKTQLEALLRRWDLEPIILDQQITSGQTIMEKLEECSKDIGYAIVLATPDDEGKSVKSDKMQKRVRQNVVLELGMFLSKLGRDKVAILLKEADDFEKPSDIHGLIYIPFQNKVDEVIISLVREMTKQGYKIDNSKL